MVHTHTAVSPPPLRSPFDLPSTSLRTPSNLQPPSPQVNILVGDAKLLGGDTLARTVERRHACIKRAVTLAGAKGRSATIVERHISIKLNTRETQVKVPLLGVPPGGLPGCKGVQSEHEVKWEFGPADVSLGRREMLHGGMLGSARGCKSGRSPGRPGAASAGPEVH